MAWYEESGPGAEQVREWVRDEMFYSDSDIFNVTESPESVIDILKEHYLDDILKKRINGKAGDYGSYRGFATFGLSPELERGIEGDIQVAIAKINRQFAAQKDVRAEVEEFGLRPPSTPKDDGKSKGKLTDLGGGMYRELMTKYDNQ